MTGWQFFSLFGGTTLCGLIITFAWNALVNGTKKKKKQKERENINEIGKLIDDKMSDMIIVKKGLQAVLRDRLYQLYRFCNERGYTGFEERENFKNMYEQYHMLGANGVMDDIKDRFFALPITKPEE